MSSGQYVYDTSGQSYFFLLTVLLLVLVPFTYYTIKGGSEKAASRVPYPCDGWNKKSIQLQKSGFGGIGLSKKQIALALGWVAFAVVVKKASTIEGAGLTYDPFKILGIASGATEKEIKKHYRKMSLKFHPDKLQLSGNQTKEEADNHFVELTKAYKSLTDEVIRHNFEMFGHPDGKQEFSAGIALPSWVVEAKNVWYVMGAYALLLGVMLPYVVGRWWYGAKKLTKDGVLNSTAATFFHGTKEDSSFTSLLDTLTSADEFESNKKLLKLRKSLGKSGVDEYARLVSTVREGPDGKNGWSTYSTWSTGKKRARVLVAAHMLRIPIQNATLFKEKLITVSLVLPLTNGLGSIALSHNWLSTYVTVLRLQQFIFQAVYPSSSALLQLPHITPEMAKAAHHEGLESVEDFGIAEAGKVEKILSGLREDEKREAYEVAKNWPVVNFVDAKFQVIGEKTVTPGAIVSFTVKLRLSPPGRAPHSPLPKPDITNPQDAVQGSESTIDELIGRREVGADGEEPTPLAHLPHFPKNRKPSWQVFIGDHKLNRIFVAPHRFTDIGSNKIRTLRITFQAPPGPGLYTFQVYVMSDSYVGTDSQKSMKMTVEPPPQEYIGADEEDEISEPDEDTIAGQMAMMKGQPVRRIPRSDDEEEDDDTSGTEDSDDDDDTDSSDSD